MVRLLDLVLLLEFGLRLVVTLNETMNLELYGYHELFVKSGSDGNGSCKA